ncbi:MAG: AAA family ATPase [Nostoc sp.]
MSQPSPENPIAHFLIGVPGSGKSALATLISQTGNYEIISTDEIRQQLYGDQTIQGDWQEIETKALKQIDTAFSKGKSVIYDATNYKRAFRMDFLQKAKALTFNLIWIAWYLNRPLETCIRWNQQRTHQVPEEIIISMHKVLKTLPPITAEGFAKVNIILSQISTTEIEKKIK